ncbi:MAG: glycosyltransferase [Cypionkella sp.]|uniref:glycosyltransferase n=1 Tax=Cypionkella sp. TaxID=2811411 RepID=UPI002ABBD67A|nr:glycosyltransferase [Cypionkella sp.]MDZ4309649.1 glycosyltransferase [Cypionkella sp.]
MFVMAIILTVIIFACGFLVLYPYAVYPFLLRRLPTKAVTPDPSATCSCTLVFCAFNEGRIMSEKLANIAALKARHPDLQVLAFDDGSKDDTAAQILARPDLLELVQGGGRNGKAHGMKLLAARATGDVIVFTDANVVLQEDAIDCIRAWHGDPKVGGLCGTLRYIGAQESVTASVGGIYWRLEEYLKMQESRSGNVMGADGSIFTIRRALYPDFPDTVLDDLTVSMATVFAGKRLIKVDDVVAYERLVAARGEEFARKIRIAARAYHTHLHLRPQLAQMAAVDRFKYASRKIVRWFGGLFLILGTASFLLLCTIVSLWLGLAATTGLAAMIWLAPRLGFKPLDTVLEISLALIATLLGVIKALRGQTIVTWTPAKTR